MNNTRYTLDLINPSYADRQWLDDTLKKIAALVNASNQTHAVLVIAPLEGKDEHKDKDA